MELNAALAAQGYAHTRPALAADPHSGGGVHSPAGALAAGFADTLARGEETAKAAMTSGADPVGLVQALSQTELAVQAAVTVRDKVVEAYQEILRMPV